MIGAITPVPALRQLLEGAMSRAESSAAMLLSEDDAERLEVWSWWRRGGVELHPDTYLRRPIPATELMGVGMLAA
jgi:hypothetical protein